jgi:N-acetylmuramoyl-L-alanine amidase
MCSGLTISIAIRHFSAILFFFVCFSVLATNTTNSIDGIRVWPAPENTRIVFDLKNKADFKYFSLSSPARLVIDFNNSQNRVDFKNLVNNNPRIKLIRSSTSKNKSSTRIVMELEGQYQLTIFPLPPAGQYGNRLVVDLYDKNRKTPVVSSQPKNNLRDIIIGIDAGHGGDDPGSIGGNGSYEKRVTLAIAKKIKALIDKEKGMTAVLIRSGDYYVDLNRRTKIARQKQVDFLVSVHADAFRTPQPNGASVWIISKGRAESEMARWLVNREKNSELLGGVGSVIKTTKDNYFALTLADMSKQHSIEESLGVAHNVISELKKITKLHKKTPQYASFSVLKASDIPSILVETGFISNHKEEKNLNSTWYQQKLATAISNGVKRYFIENPLQGSYYASVSYKKHKVSSGESLSLLAQRYKVSIAKIKLINNLKSNAVRIGQTLKIPSAG